MLNIFERFENLLSWFAGFCVFVMMVLVSFDAIGRYAFQSPLIFQFDFTTHYLMVIVGVLSLSWAEREGAMIRIKAATHILPKSVHGLLYAFNNLIVAAVFAAMTYASGKRTLETYHDGDVLFGVIDWPVWLSHVWVPIAAGALTLRLVIKACQYGAVGRLNASVDDDKL